MYTLIIMIGLGLGVGEQVDQVQYIPGFRDRAACEYAIELMQQQSNARLLAEPTVYSSNPVMVCVPMKSPKK